MKAHIVGEEPHHRCEPFSRRLIETRKEALLFWIIEKSPPSMSKTAPPFVWPHLTDWQTQTVPLVYLDLNHWIYLAQARAGLSSGVAFLPALEACRNASHSGAARFVLSGSHYMEMTKIRDPAQRRAIADVMEELTDFAVLVSRVVIMELELEATLNRFVAAAPPCQSSL